MLQREGVTDTRWTKATFTHGERKSGQELLGGGGGEKGEEEGTEGPGHTASHPRAPLHTCLEGGTNLGTTTQSPVDKQSHQHTLGQELFWKPLPSRSHRGKIPPLLGRRGSRCTGEVTEGGLDPGHFRQRGEKARGGLWVLT